MLRYGKTPTPSKLNKTFYEDSYISLKAIAIILKRSIEIIKEMSIVEEEGYPLIYLPGD